METAQRVVRRSTLFSRMLFGLVVLALLLFGYTVLRENLPEATADHWPWKLRLLDFQSATAAVIATSGAALARAQYARTVRPALGYVGRTTSGMAPNGVLAWSCHMMNGAQDYAVVAEVDYRIVLTSAPLADEDPETTRWQSMHAAAAVLEARSLVSREDFWLNYIGAGWAIPAQGTLVLGWFTERAMREVEACTSDCG